jgi:hypothetical protein
MYPSTDNDMDQNTAIERMNYVINDVVSHSVFVHEDDTDTIVSLASAGIPVLTVPDPGPIDQIIQLILTTKLSAVIEGTFFISVSKISSEIGNGVTYVYDFDTDEEDDVLPSVISEEVTKWWNDLEPRFVTLGSSEDVEEFVPAAGWEDMGLTWYDDTGETETSIDVIINRDDTTVDNNIIHMPTPVKDDN